MRLTAVSGVNVTAKTQIYFLIIVKPKNPKQAIHIDQL